MMKIMLFTTPTCQYCAPAKELLEASGVNFEYIDATQNMDLAKQYQIRSVPALIVSKCSGTQSYVGIDQIEAYIEASKGVTGCGCNH